MDFLQASLYQSHRLLPTDGYYDDPGYIPILSFALPRRIKVQFRSYDVSLEHRRFEIWSPNCLRLPVYPGLKLHSVHRESLPLRFRYYDGQLGPLDSTLNPQLFDPNEPWLAYIARRSSSNHRDSELPEFRQLDEPRAVWKLRNSATGTVVIRPDYQQRLLARLDSLVQEANQAYRVLEEAGIDNWMELWARRPRWPAKEQLLNLDCDVPFGEAVDTVASYQRGLKSRAAWLSYVRARTSSHIPSMDEFLNQELPTANDNYVGFWMDDAAYESLPLLLGGTDPTPAFVIHEYTTCEVNYHHSSIPLEWFSPRHHIYSHIAPIYSKFHQLSRSVKDQPPYYPDALAQIRVQAPLNYRPAEDAPSLSHRQGYRSPRLPNESRLLDAPLTARRVTFTPFPASYFSSDYYAFPPSPDGLSSASQAGNSQLRYRVPPAIQKPYPHEWSTWETEEFRKATVILRASSDEEPTEDHDIWYDREFGRELRIFPWNFTMYETGGSKFGQPAPVMKYLELDRFGNHQEVPASRWMYKTRVPASGTAGQRSRVEEDSIESLRRVEEPEADLEEYESASKGETRPTEEVTPQEEPSLALDDAGVPSSSLTPESSLYAPFTLRNSPFWRIDFAPSEVDSPSSLRSHLASHPPLSAQSVVQVLRTWNGEFPVYWVQFSSATEALIARGLLMASESGGYSGPLVPEGLYLRAAEEARTQMILAADIWDPRQEAYAAMISSSISVPDVDSAPASHDSSRKHSRSPDSSPVPTSPNAPLAERISSPRLSLLERLDSDNYTAVVAGPVADERYRGRRSRDDHNKRRKRRKSTAN